MISINHLTYVISVPKATSVLIGIEASTGRELRGLDVNALRLEIAALLDDESGILLPDVYAHNAEVLLDGVTYAKVIRWLSPYTFTFEDGTYAIILEGANTNLAAKTNINSVSVRPNNSAGLIVTNSSGASNTNFWDTIIPTNPLPGSYGELVSKRLLTFLNYLGYQKK